MNWFEEADKASESILQNIFEHPFIQELKSGVLERDTFLFYMEQDAVYLKGFSEILADIANQLPDEEDKQSFRRFSENALLAEQSLHQSFAKTEGIKAQPACHHYLQFLKNHSGNLAGSLAAVLPCFVVYEKVGLQLIKNTPLKGHPYASWISLYGGEEFSKSVQEAIRIGLKYASPEISMKDIYLVGCELEYLFWDGAYKKLRWIKAF
jgi:thiaminase/transcriptional activator TenA